MLKEKEYARPNSKLKAFRHLYQLRLQQVFLTALALYHHNQTSMVLYNEICCCDLTGINTRTTDVHGCPVVNNDSPYVPHKFTTFSFCKVRLQLSSALDIRPYGSCRGRVMTHHSATPTSDLEKDTCLCYQICFLNEGSKVSWSFMLSTRSKWIQIKTCWSGSVDH
jgi:hypothetical protein